MSPAGIPVHRSEFCARLGQFCSLASKDRPYPQGFHLGGSNMTATFKICASVFGLVLATATASLGSSPDAAAVVITPAAELGSETPMACCKTCTTGKACGDSCIAKNKDCHQPAGCACDG